MCSSAYAHVVALARVCAVYARVCVHKSARARARACVSVCVCVCGVCAKARAKRASLAMFGIRSGYVRAVYGYVWAMYGYVSAMFRLWSAHVRALYGAWRSDEESNGAKPLSYTALFEPYM